MPHLDLGSHRLSVLAQPITEGRFAVNLSRLGRAGRCLRSRHTVGAAVAALASCMAEARQVLDPTAGFAAGCAADSTFKATPRFVACPDLIRSLKTSDLASSTATILPRPTPALASSDADPVLTAIRAVLQNLPEPVPARSKPARLHVIDPPTKAAPENRPGSLFTRSLSQIIARSAVFLALPVGLALAALFHLAGGDLVDRD